MKKLGEWIKNNKGAIISVVTGLVSVSDAIFGWILGDKTVYVFGFNLPAFIGIAASLVIGVLTSGFTSSAVQEAYDKVKVELKESANNGISYNERVAIGKKVNELTKKVASIEKDKAAVAKEYKEYIDNVEVFQIASADDNTKYAEYKAKVAEFENQIADLNSKIEFLKAKLGD